MIVIVLIVYSVFVTIDAHEYDTRLRALQKYFGSSSSQTPHKPTFSITSTPFPTTTTKPLINPYQGSLQIQGEIERDLVDSKVSVKIINMIDNYAYITEHALPPGFGGGWCVVKKVGDKWGYVFCSQDEKYCAHYEEYNLPKWLLGECPI